MSLIIRQLWECLTDIHAEQRRSVEVKALGRSTVSQRCAAALLRCFVKTIMSNTQSFDRRLWSSNDGDALRLFSCLVLADINLLIARLC